MGLGTAFDNRSLRTKIGTAVLTATVSGLLVGILAIVTLHRQNDNAAAAQRQTVLVESATGSFSKNVEGLSGNMSALKLYPQLSADINRNIEANKTAVRAQIIAAAAQLFAAHAYDAVQMDDVARAAGIGKPTLYRYFPSKAELFLLITEMALKHVVEALGECRDSGAEAPDKLRAMVEALTDALGASFVSLRVLSGENPPLAARWRNLFRRHREAIMAIFIQLSSQTVGVPPG